MDEVFKVEQAHLSSTYAKLQGIEKQLTQELRLGLDRALADKEALLDELTLDNDAEIHVETMAEYEALGRIIDAYNLAHDINLDKLHRAQQLLTKPYFAKVTLRFKKSDAPEKDVYIGTCGMTDDARRHFIVDWRSPVAEVYYNQAQGHTSYQADGRTIDCELMCRRQFDLERNQLHAYFDTTVAIEDPLLLQSLSKQRTSTMQAITTTIQKEQNTVIRHEDVPVLLVNGIAGSGKTSVLLQRIAYLFYRQREKLDPRDVYLITPNEVFTRYIANVLPDMGEASPTTLAWSQLTAELGLESRGIGENVTIEALQRIDEALPTFKLEHGDFADIRIDDERVITAAAARSAYEKLSRFPCGTHRCSLAAENLLERLEQRIKRLAHDEGIHDLVTELSGEEQIEYFGAYIDVDDEAGIVDFSRRYLERRYAPVEQAIEQGAWLKIDRIGMRLLGVETLSSTEYLYLKLALAGGGVRNARYVMIDEVQDYTPAQLAVLARYYPNAHFMLLGDENQAVHRHMANFSEVKRVFERSRGTGSVHECLLTTSYRSSPEITALFAKLMPSGGKLHASSVQRPGTEPEFLLAATRAEHDATVLALAEAAPANGLTAFITSDEAGVKRYTKLLGSAVVVPGGRVSLPASGAVLLSVACAKGLEFDRVVVLDADAARYNESDLSRRKLYTAISRATQKVTLTACGAFSAWLAG